jgi:DNA-binding transcriptional LysR family regulator
VRVVSAGSITAAADQLGVAKSVVSRRLAELEARLGSQLLVRSTRRMSLTDAGRSYLQRCIDILADLAEAEAEAGGASGRLAGRIRMAAPLSFGLQHLSPAINDFARRFPHIAFDLDLNDRAVDLVGEGFDLALRIAELEDSNLVARRLTRIRHVVCASPGYWTMHGVPEQPEDLTRYQALRYSNAPTAAWRFTGPRQGEVRVPARMEANNGDLLRQASIAGLGVIMQPTFLVHEAIERGELQPVLMDYRWRELWAYAVYPENRHLPARVRVFIDALAARFGDEPYWDAWITERAV